jgi:hypothetical protein
VSESIDIVVHCGRAPEGPRVSEIIAVEDLAAGPESAQFTVTQVFGRAGPRQALTWSGNLPIRAGRSLTAAGIDPRRLLDADADPLPVRA